MAMLHFFLALRDEYSLKIGVFHLNHLMRGDESDRDEIFVKEICGQHKIPCHSFSHDFSGEQSSFEERARTIRYRFIADLCSEHGYTQAATAHTKSDNVETVLYRIVTGTHIRGLQGIRSKRKNIIRPLLWSTSDDVYGYLKGNLIPWREDQSNCDSGYSRNFIRHNILPLLQSRFPETERNISGLASAAAESDSLILYLLGYSGVKVEMAGDGFIIHWHELLKNALVFNHVIAALMGRVGINPSGEKIQEVRKRFNTEKSLNILYYGKEYELVKDFRRSEKILVARKMTQKRDFVWHSRILLQKGVEIESDGNTNPFEINSAFVGFDAFTLKKSDKDHIFIDVTDIEMIEIRSFLPGDRIRCGHMDRKLKRIMIDNKCSSAEKKSVPLFVSNDEILAVGFGFVQRGSHRIADKVMVGQGSKKILDIYRICAEN